MVDHKAKDGLYQGILRLDLPLDKFGLCLVISQLLTLEDVPLDLLDDLVEIVFGVIVAPTSPVTRWHSMAVPLVHVSLGSSAFLLSQALCLSLPMPFLLGDSMGLGLTAFIMLSSQVLGQRPYLCLCQVEEHVKSELGVVDRGDDCRMIKLCRVWLCPGGHALLLLAEHISADLRRQCIQVVLINPVIGIGLGLVPFGLPIRVVVPLLLLFLPRLLASPSLLSGYSG